MEGKLVGWGIGWIDSRNNGCLDGWTEDSPDGWYDGWLVGCTAILDL